MELTMWSKILDEQFEFMDNVLDNVSLKSGSTSDFSLLLIFRNTSLFINRKKCSQM